MFDGFRRDPRPSCRHAPVSRQRASPVVARSCRHSFSTSGSKRVGEATPTAFLRMTEPDLYDDVLDDWLGASDSRATIASTALGHLFIWAGGAAHLLNPLDGRVRRLTEDVEILFDTVLCDDDVLQGLRKDLYDGRVAETREAVRRRVLRFRAGARARRFLTR